MRAEVPESRPRPRGRESRRRRGGVAAAEAGRGGGRGSAAEPSRTRSPTRRTGLTADARSALCEGRSQTSTGCGDLRHELLAPCSRFWMSCVRPLPSDGMGTFELCSVLPAKPTRSASSSNVVQALFGHVRRWLICPVCINLPRLRRPPRFPPQNLDAEESVLGAMMLSPVRSGRSAKSSRQATSTARATRRSTRLRSTSTRRASRSTRSRSSTSSRSAASSRTSAAASASTSWRRSSPRPRTPPTTRGSSARWPPSAAWSAPGRRSPASAWSARGSAAEELVDKAESVIFDLSQERVAGEFTHIEELLKESFERITALYEAGADVTGIASGFRELDKLTSGFQPGNLIVVAARPSMGKSALGLCVAANLAVRQARRSPCSRSRCRRWRSRSG